MKLCSLYNPWFCALENLVQRKKATTKPTRKNIVEKEYDVETKW